jgi:hypothetical protein
MTNFRTIGRAADELGAARQAMLAHWCRIVARLPRAVAMAEIERAIRAVRGLSKDGTRSADTDAALANLDQRFEVHCPTVG